MNIDPGFAISIGRTGCRGVPSSGRRRSTWDVRRRRSRRRSRPSRAAERTSVPWKSTRERGAPRRPRAATSLRAGFEANERLPASVPVHVVRAQATSSPSPPARAPTPGRPPTLDDSTRTSSSPLPSPRPETDNRKYIFLLDVFVTSSRAHLAAARPVSRRNGVLCTAAGRRSCSGQPNCILLWLWWTKIYVR